ncbi:peptidase [Actinosynnema sp. NPDC050801]|uniref:peptidase n=1 Tax=unclassified Actinosynnema TaxID=2637065 RepID=UPI0033D4C8BA
MSRIPGSGVPAGTGSGSSAATGAGVAWWAVAGVALPVTGLPPTRAVRGRRAAAGE